MYMSTSYCNVKSLRDCKGPRLSRVRDRDLCASTLIILRNLTLTVQLNNLIAGYIYSYVTESGKVS